MSESESSSASNLINSTTERRNLLRFYELFCVTAIFQGRLAYFLMSLHAVNPAIFKALCDCDPSRFLFINMVYGIGIMLYCRPAMMTISRFHRVVFSVLGSLMFNHGSMLVYAWLADKLCHRPYLVTLLGFMSGRIMILHLLAYLYHVDTRTRSVRARTYSDYESMYT